jgi:uncharacterized protein (TIGR00266 family)
MQVEIRHNPSFAIARIHLAPGEGVEAESGAMAMHSPGIQISAEAKGGVMRGLARSVLGGESLFVTTFAADPQYPGWVDLAAGLPGDATVVEVTEQMPWVITRGSWLGNSPGVNLDTKWGGAKMLFGGEGAFVVYATGRGPVLVSTYGALDLINLEAGQQFTVDTGHLVAFQASIQTQVRKVSQGIIQSMKSGEGLVMDITGPGQVLTQSRNPQALITWLSGALPSRN